MLKKLTFGILIVATAAGVVLCGSAKKQRQGGTLKFSIYIGWADFWVGRNFQFQHFFLFIYLFIFFIFFFWGGGGGVNKNSYFGGIRFLWLFWGSPLNLIICMGYLLK